MELFFKIKYEFDKKNVHAKIDSRLSQLGGDYVCVADGVVLNMVNKNQTYEAIVNGGLLSICDSSYVPLYLKGIYGIKREQYCGSQIFYDYLYNLPKKRMIFLGGSKVVLDALRQNISKKRRDVLDMKFVELPFLKVDEFNYAEIAEMINKDGADIIWVALGAPKQEIFMSKLKPYLTHGIMIGVGAVFKFYSGLEVKRAPNWMIKSHLEFLYRIFSEPKKQIRRCKSIIISLPKLIFQEYKRKNHSTNNSR